eukprot:gene27824-33601_t
MLNVQCFLRRPSLKEVLAVRYKSFIRNVGIFAHIDAGKTTTSEGILFLCGATRSVGLVDSGDTVMDFLPQEKERGITISAAAVSCDWKGPGHVDFTMEVERTSRVLDGSVLVVDAVAGVQAQTKTVWRSIRKHSLPCIGFINKMDRAGASWSQSLKSIQDKLHTKTICLQYPLLGEADGGLNKVVDLVGWKILEWAPPGQKGQPCAIATYNIEDTGGLYNKAHIPNDAIYDKIIAARREMIDNLSDFDEDLMALAMEHDYPNIPIQSIIHSLRQGTIHKHYMPVVLGSALKGRGIQPLLDMMVGLLPSPLERLTHVFLQDKRAAQQLPLPENLFCALAFKVLQHPQRGTM